MLRLIIRTLKNRDGNFAITTALILPVLFMAVGIALDVTEMSRTQERLQNSVDAAALGAASAMASQSMSEANAKALAKSFVKGHMAVSATDATNLSVPDVTVTQTAPSANAKTFKVEVKSSFNVPLSGFQALLGFNHARVSAVGIAESSLETKSPLSMYLVLDQSGSMQWVTSAVDTSQSKCYNYYEENWPNPVYESPCYIKKINSLKTAVGALADQFETSDPNHEYIRTGAISYSSSAFTPTPLAWGTSGVKTYVNALSASGGTNSGNAFKTAYQALSAATETAAHVAKTGLTPAKYIVFMTDGANDNTNIDTTTKAWCDAAKAEGIKVYSVAFVAPDRGKQLLSYCSSGTGYYFAAENVTQLITAFQLIASKTSKLSNRLTQ